MEEKDETEEWRLDYLVLVNKENKLPEDWESKIELVEVQNAYDETIRVEKEALEKFIECFNNTSEDINLNSSFEDISIQEDINRYQKDSFDYKTSLKI